MPKVHRFTDSGEAYDASQYRDDISDGDILVVDSRNDTSCFTAEGGEERSVAVLVGAWPTVVGDQGLETDVTTSFHVPGPGSTFPDVVAGYCRKPWVTRTPDFYLESERLALAELAGLLKEVKLTSDTSRGT